jgi:hypothetical protein
LSEIALYKDGMPYPCSPIYADFEKKKFSELYHAFLKSNGAAYVKNFAPVVTLSEYGAGYTLLSFDMSPDQTGSMHPATLLNMNANVRLEMKFKNALPENVTLLIYSEMENLMEIHRDRRVTVNF